MATAAATVGGALASAASSSAGTAAIGGLASGAAGAALSGGGAAGGSSSRSGPTRVGRYTPEQADLLEYLGRQTRRGMEGVEPYPGETVPEAHQLQEQMAGFGERVMGEDPFGRGSALDQALQRSGQLMERQEFDPERTRQMWEQSVREPARQALMEDELPQISEEFAGRGALRSSGYNRAMADATRRMQTETQGQLSQLMFDSWNQHQQTEMQRAQLGGSMLGQTLGQASQLGQMGEAMRGIEQQEMSDAERRWQMQQPWGSPYRELLPQVLGASPFAVSNTSVSQQPGMTTGQQIGQGLIGAGAQSLGAAGQMWAQNQGGGSGPTLWNPRQQANINPGLALQGY